MCCARGDGLDTLGMLLDQLRLGYPYGIDEQHEKLFEICERLKRLTVDRIGNAGEIGTLSGVQRAVRAGLVSETKVDTETLRACADLVCYAMEHFQWEQEMLAKVDVLIERKHPDLYFQFAGHYRRHISEHASLHQHALIYRSQFEEHLVSALSLYVFVRHWLISHISKTDRELSYWCKVADGLPATPPAP